MLSSDEIKNLLVKLPNGDQKAWKIFINKFHPLIQGTILKYVEKQELDDVIQQVYLTLMEKDFYLIRKFESNSFPALLIYIQNISRNIGMRWKKKHAKHNAINTHFENGSTDHLYSKFNIEIEFTDYESIQEFEKNFENLDIKYREPISLKMQGYKAREIAEIFEVPINTILTRLKRAKEKIKILEGLK